MDLPDVPLFAMLRQRMTWLNQRQDILSRNVANADNPGYVARDLKPLNFGDAMRAAVSSGGLTTTQARHIAVVPAASPVFADEASPDGGPGPNGNAVSLEMEMIKVSDTQAQFQAATSLYAKAMTMMKTAIGH